MARHHQRSNNNPFANDDDDSFDTRRSVPSATPRGGTGGMSGSATNSSTRRSEYSNNNDDHDVHQLLREAKDIRGDSARVTRETLSRLRETEDSATSTMNQLATQSNALLRAKRDLELAKNHHKAAEDQVSELKRLNTFFALKNPFKNKAKKRQEEELRIKMEYEQKVSTEIDAKQVERQTQRRLDALERHRAKDEKYAEMRATSGAAASKSQHRSELLDDEDHQMENEIDSNLDEMSSILGRLKGMARAMNDEVSSQNQVIDGLGEGADDMNVRIGLSSNRLKKVG